MNLPEPVSRPFPLAWRDLALRLSGNGVLGAIAKATYRRATHHSARSLVRVEGVQGVALRGGALRHPIPAVSDIDLSIFTEGEPEPSNYAKMVIEIGRRYRRLKRVYPMLGEVCLHSPRELRVLERSGNSSLKLLIPQKAIVGRCPQIRPTVSVPIRSLFSLSLCYFERMVYEARLANERTSVAFHTSFCLRLAAKIDHVSGVAIESGLCPISIPEAMARAFQTVHQLAVDVSGETLTPSEDFDMQLAERKGDKIPPWHQQYVHSWWLIANRKMKGVGKVVDSEDPRVLLWRGPIDLKTLTTLSDGYFGPILLSPTMAECRLSGLSTDWIGQIVERVPINRASDESWMKVFKHNLFHTIRDRVLVANNCLPYHFMVSQPSVIKSELQNACGLLLALATRRWTADFLDLASESREQLPQTCQLLERLVRGKKPFSQDELVESFARQRLEMFSFFEREFCLRDESTGRSISHTFS